MKLLIKSIYHFSFWGAFTLIFIYQTPDPSIEEYIEWIITLINTAIVVYLNLFILLPYFYFRKKYVTYFLLLFLLICVGAFLLPFSVPSEDNYVQNIINYTFMIVVTSCLKFLREFLRKQELLIKSENEQLKTELSLLKAQVNPHFLFNTLNNLYGLIVQNQNEKASNITLKLSDLMRYLLESSKVDKVRVHKEIKFLLDYLDLEKIRLSKKASIKFETALSKNEVFIAPLLFIPLVENAFKHGLQTLNEEDNFAHFSLSVQENQLFFEAHNSIQKKLNQHIKSGTGLDNLKKRLALLYPAKHQLEIEKTQTSFKVTLFLQL